MLQSRFGDKSLKFKVVCPQNGTAVLKGLSNHLRIFGIKFLTPIVARLEPHYLPFWRLHRIAKPFTTAFSYRAEFIGDVTVEWPTVYMSLYTAVLLNVFCCWKRCPILESSVFIAKIQKARFLSFFFRWKRCSALEFKEVHPKKTKREGENFFFRWSFCSTLLSSSSNFIQRGLVQFYCAF